MSIEQFFSDYPATKTFAEGVSYPNINSERKSPVRFMADILTKEGREGLEEIGVYYSDAVHQQKLREITRHQGAYLNNSAAIYLGVGIMAIEDILKDGMFNSQEFDARLRLHFSGTYLDPLLVEPAGIELIESQRLREITRLATLDKTFASFFNSEFSALPQGMRNFYVRHDEYTKSRIITNINNHVLENYQKRVTLLISSNGRRSF